MSVEWAAFAERLRTPLVSADGKIVAFQPSGYHEAPPEILILKDVATDREARDVRMMGSEPDDARRARIAEAMGLLDGIHASALTVYEMATDATAKERFHGLGSSLPMEGRGEGLRVRFHEPLLLVDDDRGRPLVRRAFPRWSARERGCFIHADMSQAWGNRELGVVVVEIHYSGSPHFCEVSPAVHVIRIERRR